MKLIIKQAKIIDPNSPHNGETRDILIEKGIIKKIKKTIPNDNKVKTIQAKNLHISPGWFDMHVNFKDPGYEHKEDLFSGTIAASHGGFTGVACMPSTFPPIDSKAGIDYIKNKTKDSIVDVFPIGALSQNREGKDLSEIFDMHLAGAVAFSDDKKSVTDSSLMTRAMLYTNYFNGLVISFPNDKFISVDGIMNEGEVSTTLGLKGIPSLAEELMVARDISLAEYTQSKVHFSTISTAQTVQLIRKAKAIGLCVTAEVAAHQLILDDIYLKDYDSNYKVNPPLRTATDIKALIDGLKDGTIDAICSDHTPEDEEMKNREFEYASFGIIGLETTFALINTFLSKKLSLEQIIQKIAINPRKILQINIPVIKEGNIANSTLFDPAYEWTFKENDIHSKSKNTPFIGKTFIGKALGIINKSQIFLSNLL